MNVVTIAASKGGTGKSTITALLAVRATLDGKDSKRVGMFDLNGEQASLSQWHVLRGDPTNPELVEVEKIGQDIEILRKRGFDWLFIDTPPLDIDTIEIAILKSDAVLIPVRLRSSTWAQLRRWSRCVVSAECPLTSSCRQSIIDSRS